MLKRLNGRGLFWPLLGQYISVQPGVGTDVINTSGSRIEMVGQFWSPDNQNKVISGIQFRFGAVTKAGGTTLRVSLQTLLTGSAATGSPGQSSNVPLDQYQVQNSDTLFASNTWYTGSLSTGVSMSFGQLFSVVFETTGSGLQAGDSIGIAGANNLGSVGTNRDAFSYMAKFVGSGSTWAASTSYPNVIFQNSDGTYGGFIQGFGLSAFAANINIATGSVPNEYGLRLKIPFSCSADALLAVTGVTNNSSSFTINLYDGGTDGNSSITLMTQSFNAAYMPTLASARYSVLPFATESILAPNHIYYASILPQTGSAGSSVTLGISNAVANNLFWNVMGGTSESYQATRTNGNSWSGSLTQRPMIYLRLNQLDDGGIPSSIAPVILQAYGNIRYFSHNAAISHGTTR